MNLPPPYKPKPTPKYTTFPETLMLGNEKITLISIKKTENPEDPCVYNVYWPIKDKETGDIYYNHTIGCKLIDNQAVSLEEAEGTFKSGGRKRRYSKKSKYRKNRKTIRRRR